MFDRVLKLLIVAVLAMVGLISTELSKPKTADSTTGTHGVRGDDFVGMTFLQATGPVRLTTLKKLLL
jgi:hypothetical protein